MSTRTDGRGHWPAGKRRNPDSGQWSRILQRLQTILGTHHRRGVVSARALAAHLGVSDRAVRRWLRSEDRPAPDIQERISRWVIDTRGKIAKDAT